MTVRVLRPPGLIRVSSWQVLTALVLLAVGFLLIVQLRAGRSLGEQLDIPTRNIYAIATLLREEREARRALEEQVTDLRRRLAEYEQTAAQGRSLATAMSQELATLRAALGLKPMAGPGVEVVIKDSGGRTVGPNPVVVTYQDLVAVVNELWAAGAEAIAVNGQRVTATTGFGQVGGTVVVNLQRLTAPLTITAIGNSDTLEGALNIRGGLLEGLRAIGISISVSRHERLQVPAYTGPITFEHARPIE